MVQERDLEPRKFHEADFDAARVPEQRRRYSEPTPVPPPTTKNSPVTDAASGLALLLSLIAFFFSSYAVIQAVAARREAVRTSPTSAAPAQSNPASGSTIAQPVSRPVLPLLDPYRSQRVQPGRYIQPTYDGAGEVELLSATRANRNANVATINLRLRRLNNPVQGVGDLNLAQTVAFNSRTNERFPATQYKTPGDEPLTLSNLRPGQSVNASVTVRVPVGLDRIDLEIPQTKVFRAVPITTST